MRWFIALLLIIMLAACTVNRSQTESADIDSGGNAAAETPFPDLSNAPDAAIDAQGVVPTNEAVIETVEILLLESFPVQANVVVRGQLPTSCAVIDQITQAKNGAEFNIVLTTVHQTGVMCTEQPQPFEEMVALDILGAAAGEYQVNVTGANAVGNSFALTVDNTAPQIPPPPSSGGATLSGIVWNDSCPVDSDSDCIADGLLTPAEARISGVEVTLLLGECPGGGDPVAIGETDASGTYTFAGLKATTYCVTVTPTSAVNASILATGNWSYPGVGTGSTTISLAENEYRAIDFGWDYRLTGVPVEAAPAPTVAEPADCTAAAAYVADVTIPDDSVLSPDEPFVKTWRIRNEGTCTWGPGYSLTFSDGNQMSSPSSVMLSQTIAPGAEADISISLVAPAAAGTYQSNWLLQTPDGSQFGSRGDYPFFVQIIVSP
jgi:hypothetical protein